MSRLLEINNLKISFFTYAGEVKAVDGISFAIESGEAVAFVGESGCGKSVTALSIMGLLPSPGKIMDGSIVFNGIEPAKASAKKLPLINNLDQVSGVDLAKLSENQMRSIRGNEIGMVFQDPMTSLNPVLTIKNQLMEGLILHKKVSPAVAFHKSIELMKLVGIPSPETRINQYPHQFSGGMRQRVMIAMALSCEPKLLIADEPTTALDVTIQAQILQLMLELKRKSNTSIILITHDLGVVAGLCQKVIVMYAGKIVETAAVKDIFYNPRHPYTWGLLKSIPRLNDETKTKLVPIWGQPPDLLSPPTGCRFAPRCDYAMKICETEAPPFFEVASGHQSACWLLDSRAPKVSHPIDKGATIA
ncbi:MAG: ABC transporter ATP-binding protein [Bacillota bacterium]